jgi:hypothetical protein
MRFYGIFNMRYGTSRVCVYHMREGMWLLQKWSKQGWVDMGSISPALGMRLIVALQGK